MRSRLVLSLALVSGGALLLLVGFLAGVGWLGEGDGRPPGREDRPTPPGESVRRDDVADPPPPPRPVADTERVRQDLRPGRTYRTRVRGTLFVRGTDRDWGVEGVITINYAFRGLIDRHIEKNDGVTVVELREFKGPRPLRLETRPEDVRSTLGPLRDWLLAGADLLPGPAGDFAAGGVRVLGGLSLRPALRLPPWRASPVRLSAWRISENC